MDYTVISQLIGSIGFPIVACGYMMITNNKTIKENTDATNKMINLIEILIAKMDVNKNE